MRCRLGVAFGIAWWRRMSGRLHRVRGGGRWRRWRRLGGGNAIEYKYSCTAAHMRRRRVRFASVSRWRWPRDGSQAAVAAVSS